MKVKERMLTDGKPYAQSRFIWEVMENKRRRLVASIPHLSPITSTYSFLTQWYPSVFPSHLSIPLIIVFFPLSLLPLLLR
jgi:hypothetical protein